MERLGNDVTALTSGVSKIKKRGIWRHSQVKNTLVASLIILRALISLNLETYLVEVP